MRFSDSDYEKYKGQRMYGRVKAYNHGDGYGIVFTETGRDIFLSSYDINDKKISVGTTVRFTPVVKEAGRSGYAAGNAEIVDNSCARETFSMPNGKQISTRKISKFGYVSGKESASKFGISESDVVSHGYRIEDLGYVFVQLQDGDEYRFFSEGSPIKGDGSVKNAEGYYISLKKRFCLL